MTKATCSVCSLSPEVRAAVEHHITAGMKYRDLEKASGISRSSLQRHWKKCMIRAKLALILAQCIQDSGKFQTAVAGLQPNRPDLDPPPNPNDPCPVAGLHVQNEQTGEFKNPVALLTPEKRAAKAQERAKPGGFPAGSSSGLASSG